MQAYMENLWSLFVDMSFYIVIGLVFTGLLHAFVKKDVILKHVGKDNTGSVVKASVVGVPLPLCSCGVVPTAMYLGKSGASKGAVVSFLTSTPQTGVDSLIATYGMIGPLFAVYRAVAAFISGIVAGVFTNILCKNDSVNYDNSSSSCGCGGESNSTTCCCSGEEPKETTSCCCSGEEPKETTSCCCSGEEPKETTSCCCSGEEPKETTSCCCSGEEPKETTSCCCSDEEPQETHSCCSMENKSTDENISFGGKIKKAITYAFGDFLDEIAVHFTIGLLIAALISTLIPAEMLSDLGSPLLTMILMVVIGIPMYICSTASIPIAVTLMMKGISPGAAFVFLFAGPVTNAASLTILLKTLGKKVTTIYLAAVGICSIGFGLIFDVIIEATGSVGVICHDDHAHHHGTSTYMTVVAVIFGILVTKSLLKALNKKIKA